MSTVKPRKPQPDYDWWLKKDLWILEAACELVVGHEPVDGKYSEAIDIYTGILISTHYQISREGKRVRHFAETSSRAGNLPIIVRDIYDDDSEHVWFKFKEVSRDAFLEWAYLKFPDDLPPRLKDYIYSLSAGKLTLAQAAPDLENAGRAMGEPVSVAAEPPAGEASEGEQASLLTTHLVILRKLREYGQGVNVPFVDLEGKNRGTKDRGTVAKLCRELATWKPPLVTLRPRGGAAITAEGCAFLDPQEPA